jgi:hypothetical protein
VTITKWFGYETTIKVPSYINEDIYTTHALICRKPDERLSETIASLTCLSPTINIQVTNNCTTSKPIPDMLFGSIETKYVIMGAIGVAIIALSALLVSKTKRKRT